MRWATGFGRLTATSATEVPWRWATALIKQRKPQSDAGNGIPSTLGSGSAAELGSESPNIPGGSSPTDLGSATQPVQR